MANTIDMQSMRYINLFEKISNVSTTKCFVYNNVIIFAVPKYLIAKAIGKDGENVRKISEILSRKIKVIQAVDERKDIFKFVSDIVEPVTFNKIEVKDNCVSISAGKQSKAALIGRNRTREQELEDILKKFFDVDRVRIV